MNISFSDTSISMEMDEVFNDVVPFISKPLVTTNIQVLYKTDNIDSVSTFELKSKINVLWAELSEPEIKRIRCYTQDQSPRGPIIWEPDSKGFYYHGNFGIYSQLLYYSLSSNSIKALTSSTSRLKVYDVSHDGELLLIADDIAEPENIYLYDLSIEALHLLLPARENFGVSSARFSSDDNIIAFTIVDKILPSTKDPIWLYFRNDLSLINIKSVASNSFPIITSWFSESNDRFVFHYSGTSLYNYSIKDSSLSELNFGFPFFPCQFVLDDSKVIGTQINEIETPDVTESHVWIYDSDTNPISQLTFYPEVIIDFSLSPDCSTLAFTAYRDNEYGLWLLSVGNIISNIN